ncbi:hypothetical protein I552_0911 [Mycobacterium xenopi 3993]|nr:hypothetical protein I552_0911 [Mycobacterium xenopi 3993]
MPYALQLTDQGDNFTDWFGGTLTKSMTQHVAPVAEPWWSQG